MMHKKQSTAHGREACPDDRSTLPSESAGWVSWKYWTLVPLAAGTLFYLFPWARLGLIPGDIEYHVEKVQLGPAILATAINTLFATVIFAVVAILGVRWNQRTVGHVFLWTVIALLVLGILRAVTLFLPLEWLGAGSLGNLKVMGAALLAGCAGGFLSARFPRLLAQVYSFTVPIAVIWLTVFGGMIFPVLKTLYPSSPSPTSAESQASSNVSSVSARIETGHTPSIVWIIFDEFDASVAFNHRPASMSIPHIDAFRKESVSFSRAYSPSNSTVTAVPSLLTGSEFTTVSRKFRSDLLLLKPEGVEEHSFRDTPNVISWANKAGVPVTLVGWTHPYCRIFGDQLAQCAWQGIDLMSVSQRWAAAFQRLGTWAAAVAQAEQEAMPSFGDLCADRLTSNTLNVHAYEGMRERIRSILVQQRKDVHRFLTSGVGGLRILHLATPHPPPVAQGTPESGSEWLRGSVSISANFTVADNIFAEIRGILEGRGEWDESLVILTSDHGLRSFWEELGCLVNEDIALLRHRNELHVPLMVKWPNESRAIEISDKVSTLMIAPLIRGHLEGRIHTRAQFEEYLKLHLQSENIAMQYSNSRKGD